jgi:membrane protease YdiL (CAAX protease family)
MNREAHSSVDYAPSSQIRKPAITSLSQWLRLLLGLVLVFFLFHGTASTLASDRGQAGLFIGALVVTATLVVERVLFRQRGFVAARALGLGPPRALGLIAAIATGSLLLSVIFIFVQVRGVSFAFFPGWVSLVGGLFAQAGVAEESLFRGYLFGRVRLGRTFWRAAVLSMLPFVAVHYFCFSQCPGRSPSLPFSWQWLSRFHWLISSN